MVPDTPDVEAVLFGEAGVAAGLKAGKTVVDMPPSAQAGPAVLPSARRLAPAV